MIMIDMDKLPPEVQARLMDDKDFFKQAKYLSTPGGANLHKIIQYVRQGLITPPVSGRGGGQAVKRQWAPWTPSQFDASVRLVRHLPMSQVAEVSRLSLILMACEGFRDVLNHLADFRGKAALEPGIIFWLGTYCDSLKLLYSDILSVKRLDYFSTEGFKTVVFGLTHGLYDGYTVSPQGKLVRPKAGELPDPEKSLNEFVPEPLLLSAARA